MKNSNSFIWIKAHFRKKPNQTKLNQTKPTSATITPTPKKLKQTKNKTKKQHQEESHDNQPKL